MKPLLILSLIFFILYSCNPFRNKNTLIQAIDELPLGLDPAVNYSIDDKQIYSQIYESLLCLDQDYKTLVPNLAQSWQNSPGNDTISIHLKNNVYFHDGSKVSSYSVQKSVEWLKASSELNEFSEQIKDVVIKDSLNFRFILNQPSAVFTYYLASPQGLMVMSEKALKEYGSEISRQRRCV